MNHERDDDFVDEEHEMLGTYEETLEKVREYYAKVGNQQALQTIAIAAGILATTDEMWVVPMDTMSATDRAHGGYDSYAVYVPGEFRVHFGLDLSLEQAVEQIETCGRYPVIHDYRHSALDGATQRGN